MIKVLMIDARNIPRRSEMPIYRHQPRYCLKSPNTGTFIIMKNSTNVGYKSMNHAFLNCILWITKKESIREAAKTTICVKTISGLRKRSKTVGGAVGNTVEPCFRPMGALFALFSDIRDLSSKYRCQLTTSLIITTGYAPVSNREKNVSRIRIQNMKKLRLNDKISNISKNYFSGLDSEFSGSEGVFPVLVSVMIGSISFSSRGL